MSLHSRGLFHTRLSALLNISRLLPSLVLADVLNMELPVASQEGFIRQILGWREFVHHVHMATDGFRNLPSSAPLVESASGDGGYRNWAGNPWTWRRTYDDPDGGASPNVLGGQIPPPPAFWGERSGFACLDHVVAQVWEDGYSHHITRLMILSNIATLLDVRPRDLTDWFWVAHTDAYDWVVDPNVLGMGTFALGDLMTTKPYVSGAAYINKMGDYCTVCPFDPKTNCPISNLYWAFLDRHEQLMKGNPRLSMPLASLRRRSKSQRTRDQAVFRAVREMMLQGGILIPHNLLRYVNGL